MSSYIKKSETIVKEDAEGNISSTTKETTKKIEKIQEPDYIKIYTAMWCEYNQIPQVWRDLFLQLALRMTYCKIQGRQSGEGGQLVNVGKPFGDDICRSMGWKVKDKTSNQLMQGLRELCKCNAIKKINRGVYQINPQYAGKGEWKYNPNAQRGGVENLIAHFNFKNGTVETKIDWADDGTNNPMNEEMKKALGIENNNDTTILYTTTKIKD